MPWVRFDDSAPDNPKLDSLSDGAFRLWFNSICFSNRNLTDGYVPNPRIPRLTPRYKPAHMNELVDAGAWHKEQGGVRIHDYLNYQPSSQQVQDQRAYERDKKARQRTNGTTQTANDPTNGRFMSPRDNHGDSPRESFGESPATQPNPTQVPNKSSSSEPRVDRQEEEDEATEEARRRYTQRQGPPVIDPEAWVHATAKRLRVEGFTPATPRTPRPDCTTCENLRLVETADGYTPCPECLS